MTAVAERLVCPQFMRIALGALNRPEMQLAEALAALGDGCERAVLAAAIGVAVDDKDLVRALGRLAGHALAWPEGDRIRTAPLHELWPWPLRLGEPAEALLNQQCTREELRRIARTLNIPAAGTKRAVLAAVVRWLSTGDNVRALVRQAPAGLREDLIRVAHEGGHLLGFAPFGGFAGFRGRALPGGLAEMSNGDHLAWALDRGILVGGTGWEAPLEMPCEVALALRGPGYRIPFDPQPPALRTVQVAVESVARESAAAASAALRATAALLDECGRTPLAVLKSGGVGVRELRRLAKALGDSEENVRFWLELAARWLVAETEAGVLPTEEYDRWRRMAPSEQLSTLLSGWLSMELVPLAQADQYGGTRRAALSWDRHEPAAPMLRAAVLAAALTVPPGTAVADTESLAVLTAWLRPIAADPVAAGALGNDLVGDEELTGMIAAMWREAHLLGVAAHNAISDLGRAVVAGDVAAIEAAAKDVVPAPCEEATFQADLTALVPGTPSADLLSLLDGTADRESRGDAWIWRFSATSVCRAFDAGAQADDLLARLRRCAVGRRLPQPLEYLIRDTARRHGRVRVRAVSCCLRGDDPALLAELLQHRALKRLGLSQLAPTVLASTASVDQTLAALRAAGYAPAEEGPDGSLTVRRVVRQRAATTPVMSETGGLPGMGILPAGFAFQGEADGIEIDPDDLPEELIEELLDELGGLPRELLSAVIALGSGRVPGRFSEPAELARRLAAGGGAADPALGPN